MAKKIVATGTSLVITDTSLSGAVVYEHPLKYSWFNTEELVANTPIIVIYPINITLKKGYRVTLSDSLDDKDATYTAATWRTFAQNNLCKVS